MRLIISFLSVLVIASSGVGQMKMIIHKSDGKKDSLWLSNIQSIQFQKYGASHMINLKYGKDTLLQAENISIGFKDLLDDSRCASDAVCVWEGVSHAKLWMKKTDQDTVFVTVPIYGYVNQSSPRHITVDTASVGFSLLQLDPYPKNSEPHPKSDYSAMLKVILP